MHNSHQISCLSLRVVGGNEVETRGKARLQTRILKADMGDPLISLPSTFQSDENVSIARRVALVAG